VLEELEAQVERSVEVAWEFRETAEVLRVQAARRVLPRLPEAQQQLSGALKEEPRRQGDSRVRGRGLRDCAGL
jgi:hypothetical protein